MGSFPLASNDGSQPMAYPFVQFLKRAFDLGKSEVGGESPKLRRKGDYDVLKTATAPRAQDFPDSAA